MPQIYCNDHARARASHAVCGSGAECHGHANAPPITALWPCAEADQDVATMPIGSDTHKPAEMATIRHDITQNPRPTGPQADLASAARPSEAARVTSASWIGVDKHQIHQVLPLLRWADLEPAMARCHHRVSIGPIQVGVSLPHDRESHCDLRLEKPRVELEQEPPFGGTGCAQCSLELYNVITGRTAL